MKNKKVIFGVIIVLIVIIISVFAWTKISRKIPFEKNDGKLMAIINLGDNEENYDYSLVKKYYGNKKMPEINISDSEKYLIIPRYADSWIDVYEFVLKEDGTFEKISRGTFNEPFYLTYEASDIYSVILIELVYDNETYNYSPYISLKDGSLFVEDFVLEVTK